MSGGWWSRPSRRDGGTSCAHPKGRLGLDGLGAAGPSTMTEKSQPLMAGQYCARDGRRMAETTCSVHDSSARRVRQKKIYLLAFRLCLGLMACEKHVLMCVKVLD